MVKWVGIDRNTKAAIPNSKTSFVAQLHALSQLVWGNSESLS
jgi:hypothetical protein